MNLTKAGLYSFSGLSRRSRRRLGPWGCCVGVLGWGEEKGGGMGGGGWRVVPDVYFEWGRVMDRCGGRQDG